jgi:3-oxoacyl-[acyl-carrier protein] reductase
MNDNRTTTAIITGASGGIGAAIAAELSGNGIFTLLLSRDVDKIEEMYESFLAKERKGGFYQCNVTKQSDVERVIEAEEERLQNSHIILVNNAGYGGPFQQTNEMSEEEWDAVFDVNVKAAFLCCKYVLPLMKNSGWGRIVNIASIYGSVGGALSAAYSASKHALVGYTKSIAAEWGQYGITCNCISPGFIDTRMGAASDEQYYQNIIGQVPVQRQGRPEEVAKLISFLSREESGYINGADIKIDGGLSSGRSFK